MKVCTQQDLLISKEIDEKYIDQNKPANAMVYIIGKAYDKIGYVCSLTKHTFFFKCGAKNVHR